MTSYPHTSAARAMLKSSARTARLPRRNPETERTVFARLAGRPNDEDLVVVAELGFKPVREDRFALLRRGVGPMTVQGVVARNTVISKEALAEADCAPGPTFKVFANVGPEVIMETLAAAKAAVGESKSKTVYLLDDKSAGVAKFARVNVDVVSDDARVTAFLQAMLPRAPKSTVVLKGRAPFCVTHSKTVDAEAKGTDAYVMYDAKNVAARGVLPKTPTALLDGIASMAAKELLEKRQVLVLRGDASLDNDVVTLHLGGPAPKVNDKLQAAHHVVWGSAGITRLWEGVATANGVHPLMAARSLLGQPNKIVLIVDGKVTGKDQPCAKDRAKTLVEKLSVASGESVVPLFEKLVQDAKVEVVVRE